MDIKVEQLKPEDAVWTKKEAQDRIMLDHGQAEYRWHEIDGKYILWRNGIIQHKSTLKCLVITGQDQEKIISLLPVNDLSTVKHSDDIDIPPCGVFPYTWVIFDLDHSDETDSENLKTFLSFLAKRIIVISKNFNRLMYYKDFCEIFFGWDNFLELNFFYTK